MAEQVTCVCGRKCHMSSGRTSQCRSCGRRWSGRRIGPVETAITLLLGGEVANAKGKKGDRKRSEKKSSRGKQTDKKRPANNPAGAAWRLFFG